MKQKSLLKTMLLLFALIAGSSSVWADTETFAYGDYKGQGTQSTGSSYTMVKTDVSIGSDKFYGNNSYAHFYAGGTTTITPGTGVTITSIELTASSTSYNGYQSSGKVTASTGSVSGSTSSTTVTWTGSATAAFTISNDKQIRWTSIVVTYTKSGGSSPSISLSANSVSPTCTAGDGTITVTYNNIASVDAEVKFYESDGTTSATYTWIDADINGDNNVYYTYDANAGASRTAYMKVHEKNEDVYSGLITITQAAYEVTAPEFSLATGSYIQGATFTLTSAGNTIYYTTDGSTPSTSSNLYTGPIAMTAAKVTYKAIAVDGNNNESSVATRTYTGIAPVSLPFSWAKGTTRATINSMTGVSQTGLDSDYSDNDYKLKFNGDNDNIIIFMDAKPAKVTIGVKMLGGGTTSKFSIQESTNGAEFTEVEQLTISGSQDDVVNLETTADFAATTRVIKLNFIKGSNVGVGPVSITASPIPVTITAATWASFSCNKALDFTGTGVTAYIAKSNGGTSSVTLTEIAKVPANTGIVVSGSAATHNIPVLAGEADATTGNLLKPWLTAGTPGDAEYYTLAVDGSNNPKFKKSSGGTLAAGKAYLVVAGALAPELGVDFGGTTSISEELRMKSEEFATAPVYNLAGQRVAQPTKGLYIVNGKKVIIK